MHAYTLQTARSVRSSVLVKRLLAKENINTLQPQSFHFAQKMLENGGRLCHSFSNCGSTYSLKKGNLQCWNMAKDGCRY